jgi:hypothetical protein
MHALPLRAGETILPANVFCSTAALANPPARRAAPFAKGAFGSPPLLKEGQGGFRQQNRDARAPR